MTVPGEESPGLPGAAGRSRGAPTVSTRAPGEIVTGLYLRHLRERAGLSVRQTAAAVGSSTPTLSRLERALVPVTRQTAAALLRHYSPGDVGRFEPLLVSLPYTGRHVLPLPFADTAPGAAERFALVQQHAHTVITYTTCVLPAPYRTLAYHRAVRSHAWPSTVLASPTTYRARDGQSAALLVDQRVLEVPVGGRSVMAAQLRLLARIADTGSLVVRVVPFAWSRRPLYPHVCACDLPHHTILVAAAAPAPVYTHASPEADATGRLLHTLVAQLPGTAHTRELLLRAAHHMQAAR